MDMTIAVLDGGIQHAKLAGRLDMNGATRIDRGFHDLIGGHLKVIIDLQEVTLVSSMGLRTLIIGAKALEAKAGRMVLLNPAPDVEKVLTETGVATLIPILRDLDAAVAALAG